MRRRKLFSPKRQARETNAELARDKRFWQGLVGVRRRRRKKRQ